LPVPTALMHKLRDRMIAKAAKPDDLIFPNTIGGVEGHFLRKLQSIAERAGVVEPELHRFRKSYADTLADEGLPVPTIMKRLGHCSLDVTLAHLRGGEAEGSRNKILPISQRWRCMPKALRSCCKRDGAVAQGTGTQRSGHGFAETMRLTPVDWQ
jgi:integrase